MGYLSYSKYIQNNSILRRNRLDWHYRVEQGSQDTVDLRGGTVSRRRIPNPRLEAL